MQSFYCVYPVARLRFVGLLWKSFQIPCMLVPQSTWGGPAFGREVKMARYMYQVAYTDEAWESW